ncbi:hypothetical protein ABZ930_23420 [Streptomyces sp. NPDC046716]|uniref:hypothetical protein n=1 Tax=Streptomyces sp. NPDC046716 TaxID=3157093 RepID=UPI0033F7FD59
MTNGSLARRFWRSFTGGVDPHHLHARVRAREGYSLWLRIWASFIGTDLPSGSMQAEPTLPDTLRENRPTPRAADEQVLARPPAPGWFPLPRLPQGGGLAAAGGDTVLLEASAPDGIARFLVHSHAGPIRGHSLEVVVPDAENTVPMMTALRYPTLAGPEQTLLVPVVRAPLGPAASYVRLPGFSGEDWTASAPIPVSRDSAWDAETVALSVGASLNEATRNAWRAVRATISDADLRHVIDRELP